MKWHRRQKRFHKKLYLEYRKEEVLVYLDLFLSVNHPEWAVKKFLREFTNDQRTVREMFARVLICGGNLAYSDVFPYQDDLNDYIGFMLYRQYIRITESMRYSEIMKLPRVIDLSLEQRKQLIKKLLPNIIN